MKLNKFLLSTLVGASLTVGFTSCNDGDFLEEHSYNLDSNTFYNSENDIEMALNSCYQRVQYMVMGVMHNQHSWNLMGIDYDTFANLVLVILLTGVESLLIMGMVVTGLIIVTN